MRILILFGEIPQFIRDGAVSKTKNKFNKMIENRDKIDNKDNHKLSLKTITKIIVHLGHK